MSTVQSRASGHAVVRRSTTTSKAASSRAASTLSIADPAAAADLAAFTRQVTKSPASARAFLHKVGILTRGGKLSRRYGG